MKKVLSTLNNITVRGDVVLGSRTLLHLADSCRASPEHRGHTRYCAACHATAAFVG